MLSWPLQQPPLWASDSLINLCKKSYHITQKKRGWHEIYGGKKELDLKQRKHLVVSSFPSCCKLSLLFFFHCLSQLPGAQNISTTKVTRCSWIRLLIPQRCNYVSLMFQAILSLWNPHSSFWKEIWSMLWHSRLKKREMKVRSQRNGLLINRTRPLRPAHWRSLVHCRRFFRQWTEMDYVSWKLSIWASIKVFSYVQFFSMGQSPPSHAHHRVFGPHDPVVDSLVVLPWTLCLYLSFVKVAQILKLAHFFCFQHINFCCLMYPTSWQVLL